MVEDGTVKMFGSVNAAYYVDILKRLRKRVIREDIAVTWALHHDSVLNHKSLRIR